jgi:hypothetical protein
MTPEDEEFNRVEMESRIKQEYIREMKQPSREQLMAEVAVLTELVRVLSDRVAELEKGKEPVAYINIEKRRLEWAHDYMSWDTPTVVNLPRIPLYTTPQQRTWVGLTDEEIKELDLSNYVQVVRIVEAKLKEKNNG